MDEQPGRFKPRVPLRSPWPFALVLLASVLLIVGQPLASGVLGERGSFDFFFSVLIGAVALMVFDQREHRRVALVVGISAFVAVWAGYGIEEWPGRLLGVVGYLLAAGFFAFALYGILRGVLARHTSGGALFGAVCGYLLLGIIWSVLYAAVETGSPGSFQVASTPDGHKVPAPDRATLTYFSFITLATVGYGDVTPATPLARTLAWMEAVAGQFYLAVLVAGLVGFKVGQAMKR
jgi:voltage-gated potassium channel